MDGGVPSLPENYIERGTPAKGCFVVGVVEKLLSGRPLDLIVIVCFLAICAILLLASAQILSTQYL